MMKISLSKRVVPGDGGGEDLYLRIAVESTVQPNHQYLLLEAPRALDEALALQPTSEENSHGLWFEDGHLHSCPTEYEFSMDFAREELEKLVRGACLEGDWYQSQNDGRHHVVRDVYVNGNADYSE